MAKKKTKTKTGKKIKIRGTRFRVFVNNINNESIC
jgi:hypothetical protein